MIKDLFGILVIVSVNGINLVILVNIWIIQIVSVKKLIDPLIEECAENDDQTKIVNITVKNENNYECTFCIVYIVLMIVAFTVFAAITVYLIYYNWYLIIIINNNNNNNNNNDNNDKNKNLMNVIIKNGHNKTSKY